MPAFMDLHEGDEIYRIPETVVSVERETEANRYAFGRHYTGRVIIVTRIGGVESTSIVPAGSLVHGDGCQG